MFARFDENPAMTLRVIKETKRYVRTDARTDGRTDNVKTVYPLQTKFAGGINIPHRFDEIDKTFMLSYYEKPYRPKAKRQIIEGGLVKGGESVVRLIHPVKMAWTFFSHGPFDLGRFGQDISGRTFRTLDVLA